MPKIHIEFVPVDFNVGWETPPGYPDGFKQKILASDLDEDAKTGRRSRLLRIEHVSYTTLPFVHDHWEEVFLFQGDLTVGNDTTGKNGNNFRAPTYAIRPPGTPHGPFTTVAGCVLFEMH